MQVSYHRKSYIKPIQVPGSKSVNNRLLILHHLFFPNMHIGNASKSTDTLSLQKCLSAFDTGTRKFHIEDGGTTLRFLLAYLAVKNKPAVVTCGPTLFQRPHQELLNTLNQIGFHISEDKSGFTIQPVDLANIKSSWIVNVSRSSQFATALTLVAPYLKKEIQIVLNGEPVSKGYLDLTLELMQDLGFMLHKKDNCITVQPFSSNQNTIVATTESDWSSISYFVAICRLSNQSITLLNVQYNSLQPDIDILNFASLIGIDHHFEEGNLILYPQPDFKFPKEINRDYTNCPDIALTEMVACHALGIRLHATGIDHLKYKESNRHEVISKELSKFTSSTPSFQTHNDHRIAMCLTCLSIIKPIQIDDISVVSKSFPDFWQEVSKLGIYLTPNNGK